MKSKKTIIPALLFTLSFSTFASEYTDAALKLVPGSKVVQEKVKEVKLQTTNGSIVEVEFKANGSFEEASGDNIDKDVFVPANNLITLKDAVENLKKMGKTPVGEWTLEESLLQGWHYEFQGYEEGKKFDYHIDAKSGKFLGAKLDD